MYKKVILFLFISAFYISCHAQKETSNDDIKTAKKKKKKKYKIADIDLSHWKVTIPEGEKGKPHSVSPPEILNYATNEHLKPYMYNDSLKGALVFYAYPSNSTTANSKYSRSELREQMVAGDDNTNWTFAEGGTLKGKLSVSEEAETLMGNIIE